MVAPRGILWDMDGVIVDSGHYHYLAYLEVLSALGVELPEKRYREQLFGRRNFDIHEETEGPPSSVPIPTACGPMGRIGSGTLGIG